ncbi:MAG: type II toxin-antitoxin system VapC family toxin [Kineosporiaceae bacterium]
MMTYVDTSALIELIITEPGTERAVSVWNASDLTSSSALVEVEAAAALAAARRGGRLSAGDLRDAGERLDELLDALTLVGVTPRIVTTARHLAGGEALRGYDAVHLAAALTLRADVLASADRDVCAAARRNGLHAANPLDT